MAVTAESILKDIKSLDAKVNDTRNSVDELKSSTKDSEDEMKEIKNDLKDIHKRLMALEKKK